MERRCLFVSVTVVMLFLTQWRWYFQKDSSLCVRLFSQVLLYTLSAAAEVNGVMSSSGGEEDDNMVVSRGQCCTYQGGVDYKKAYHTCGSWDLSPFVWCIKFYYWYFINIFKFPLLLFIGLENICSCPVFVCFIVFKYFKDIYRLYYIRCYFVLGTCFIVIRYCSI